ncbi:hypothetical protein V5O48_003849 [Marasmius crinis-equi]|uniref:Small ribosomal subunit protein uS7 domain-containing protein n=1 Tax=Marasmius crinis-equi TaxID=585013 RepID=A0ABR3FRS5_9AGAR
MFAATLRQATRRAALPCPRRPELHSRFISIATSNFRNSKPKRRNDNGQKDDILSAYEELGLGINSEFVQGGREDANVGAKGNEEALDALSSSESVVAQDDYLSLAIPSLQSKNKSNLPSLMNIPPQEDPLLHFMASRLMNHGERAKATRTISRMLLHIHAWTRSPPLPIVRQAMFKLSPMVHVIGHKHSTKMIYKPIPLSEKQGAWWAMKWLLEQTRNSRQGGPTIAERLAREIILVIRDESETLKKKEQYHKTAMMNRGNITINRNA